MGKVCVFGSNGYIGRHIAKKLAQSSLAADTVLGDIQNESLNGSMNYQQVDITDAASVERFLGNAESIFLLSGRTGTVQGFEQFREFIEVNEIGLLNVLSVCRKLKRRPKIIYPSTRLVYEGQRDVYLKESDAKKLSTIYAVNKFAAERYLHIYAECFDIKFAIFRICVPYGSLFERDHSYGTLRFFISQAQNGEAISVFGSGEQRRTLTHIEDLVDIVLNAGLSGLTDNQIFNVGGNDHLSIREIADMIAQRFDVEVRSVPWTTLSSRVESGDTIFDSSKLDDLFGFKYKHTFSQWCNSLIGGIDE